ncbi:MAG: Stage 0 sporulation family protein [Succiniclasticum sp.]
MTTIVGVRFKRTCKIYYFDPASTGVVKGDDVIVETTWGKEFGTIAVGPKEVEDKHVPQPLKAVVRKATDNDRKKVAENGVREKEAFNICQRCIKRHNLEMNLVDVEFTFDVSRIIFYFTADGRIDFRELVKDLASVFRTRIELRQIGVRDEARMVGGIGCCGRPLCCASWMGDFEPVSIRMAKSQNLSLNPTKISGCCGRLMCCLKFEDYLYEKPTKGKNKKQRREKAEMPQVGTMVATSLGNGKVTTVNKAKHTATVQLTPDNVVTLEWSEIMHIDKEQAEMD